MARKAYKFLAGWLVFLAIAPAIGCGGGGGTTSSLPPPGDGNGRGTLTLQIRFPARITRGVNSGVGHRADKAVLGTRGTLLPFDGRIPDGTQAVKLLVTNPTTGASLALPQTITPGVDQASVPSPQTVSFTGLPVGPVRIQALAYPDVAADSANDPMFRNPIGVGTADGQIIANTTATVHVLMTLTLDHITLTPSPVNLVGSQSVLVTANAFDKNNNPLIYPFSFSSSNPNLLVFSQSGPNTALVFERSSDAIGTGTITAIESNSQMTATVPFNAQ